MGFEESGVVLRQSRVSYIYNYLLAALIMVFFVLLWLRFDITFNLFPSTTEMFLKSFVVLGFFGLIAFLFEEPVIRRLFRYYVITNSEVIMVDGILRKSRIIIPHNSIAHVRVYKGITGRIFDFGDIIVRGFRDQITMHGIRNPELFYRVIDNKISLMRGSKHIVAKEEPELKERAKRGKEKKKPDAWRKEGTDMWKETEKREKKKAKRAGKTKRGRRFSLRKKEKEEEKTEEKEETKEETIEWPEESENEEPGSEESEGELVRWPKVGESESLEPDSSESEPE